MQPIYSRRRFLGLMGGTALAGAAAFGIGRTTGATATTATPPAASPVAGSPADELILRIEEVGGFVPVEYNLTRLPTVSVYADGRVITTGPMIEIYPQPALPNLRVTTLTEEGLRTVFERAREAGLLEGDVHYEGPPVTDLPDTVFTVNVDGEMTKVSAYALGFEEESLPPTANAEARAELIEFRNFMTDLQANLPDEQIATADEPYEIEKIKIYAREFDAENPPWDDPALAQPEMEWPLDTPISAYEMASENPISADTRCAAFTGEEAETLVDALEQANELTPWQSDGELYQLWVRPLLPDEPATCA